MLSSCSPTATITLDMTQRATHYEIEVQHPSHINNVPVDEYSVLRQEFDALPLWRQLLATPRRFRPLFGETNIMVEIEDVPDRYESLKTAIEAASRIAAVREADLHPNANVVVFEITPSGREEVGGFYPGGTQGI